MLHIQGLEISFAQKGGWQTLVKDVTFDVATKETLAIVGESGSGKSLTCQSLLGLLPPDTCRVSASKAELNGINLLTAKGQSEVRGKYIGMVFQDPQSSLTPHRRIGSQLLESLLLHNRLTRSEAKHHCIKLLKDVGIGAERFDDYPFQFSGGQKQRIMLAMTLIADPELLIADEPTTALDVTVQATILALLKKLRDQRGLGLIFVSHDLGLVAGLADKVIVMQHGKIVEHGSADQVLNNPQHSYTQALLAASKLSETTQPDQSNTLAPILEARNLAISYPPNKKPLVSGVSLRLYEGQICGLVGESGSGKSTLGRALLGPVRGEPGRIVKGQVRFQEHAISHFSHQQAASIRPLIQNIYQDPFASLNPRYTVHATLSEILQSLGLRDKHQIHLSVAELLDDVGLSDDFANRYPHQLSGGQLQRVAIARALATKPKILIADEPVSALDVSIQAQILELLKTLAVKYQLAILLISHDLAVVRNLCQYVAVMYQGTIVEQGSAAQVLFKPQHEYTQTLLDAAANSQF